MTGVQLITSQYFSFPLVESSQSSKIAGKELGKVKNSNFSTTSASNSHILRAKRASNISNGQNSEESASIEGEEIEEAIGILNNIPLEEASDIDREKIKIRQSFNRKVSDTDWKKLQEGFKFLESLLPFEVIAGHKTLAFSPHENTLKQRIKDFISSLGIYKFSNSAVESYKKEFKEILSLEEIFLESILNFEGEDVKQQMLPFQLLLIKKVDKLQQRIYNNLHRLQAADGSNLSPEQKEKISKHILKWQVELNKLKSQLDIDLVKYGISTASTVISAVQFPLDHQIFTIVPSQVALQIASLSLEGLGVGLSLLRIGVLAFEIFRRKKQIGVLSGWAREYEFRQKTTSAQPAKVGAVDSQGNSQEIKSSLSDTDVKINTKLRTLLNTKFKVERKISNFRFNSACLYLATAGAVITISAALLLISTFVLPIPAIGAMLFLLGAGSLAVTTVLVTASLHLSYKYLPASTISSLKLVTVRLFYSEIRAAISAYLYNTKVEKQLALAKLIDGVASGKVLKGKESVEYDLLITRYSNAKKEAEMKAERVIYWNKRIDHFKEKHQNSVWKDLVSQVEDYQNINPKQALKEIAQLLADCDLEQLSSDNKYLLEVQMGFNIKELQEQKAAIKDTDKFLEGMIGKVRHYFTLTDYQLINFLKSQRELIEEGLLNPNAY